MARPDPGPEMERLAEEFVGLMRDLDWKLDYSEKSVGTLEPGVQASGDIPARWPTPHDLVA